MNIVDDYNKDVGEDDLSHVNEILQYHDVRLDPSAGSFQQFKRRCQNNLITRCLHHHTFEIKLVKEILGHINLKILNIQFCLPHHIVSLSKKLF